MELNEIKQYIDENDISKMTNTWIISHQRFYVCNWLRENTSLNLQRIADMVGYSKHDRVIHAIRKHKDYSSYNDKVYRDNTKHISSFLNGVDIEKDVFNLKDAILNVNSMIELHQLQNKIRRCDDEIREISRV